MRGSSRVNPDHTCTHSLAHLLHAGSVNILRSIASCEALTASKLGNTVGTKAELACTHCRIGHVTSRQARMICVYPGGLLEG